VAEDWVSTSAGAHLSGRRKRDTEPEIMLRKALYALGSRYRVQRKLAKGCTPDILFPGARVAVFVDGDFWHGCPVHGRTEFNGPNAKLWRIKLERNRERDRRSTELAHELGYAVVRLWECDIRRDAAASARLVCELVADRSRALRLPS
jgi:DNA mismatch endonuclease (patch repair protein)